MSVGIKFRLFYSYNKFLRERITFFRIKNSFIPELSLILHTKAVSFRGEKPRAASKPAE